MMERGVYFKKEIQSNNLFYNESSHLLFSCPTAIFWPLPIRQPHLPDVNHCVYQLFTRWSPGANPLTLTQRLNLLGDSPHHLIASIYLFMNIYIYLVWCLWLIMEESGVVLKIFVDLKLII